MSAQITVRLSDELRGALDDVAGRTGRRPSEIVRLALTAYLGSERRAGDRPADRVSDLLGSLESGIPDLATRHRQIVLESLRRGS